MISFGRIVLCGLMMAGMLLSSASQLAAQAPAKPAVVVSLAKADKLLSDIGYLTRAAGAPEFGGLVTLMAGPYLQGIDAQRPAGVLLQFAGPQPTGVAFLPVSNLDAFLQQLENASIEVEDAGGGLKRIQVQRPIYLKHSNGWLFASDAENNLANVPQDPSASLGTLPEKYNLAVQLNVRSLDPGLIDMAVSEMKAGFERNLEAEDDEDKRKLQERVGRQSLESFVRLLQESDQLTVGWGVDAQKGTTFLDVDMTAVANTKLAQQMANYTQLKSSFTGMQVPDAAATLRFTSPIPPEEVAQAREALKAMREQAMSAIESDEKLRTAEARDAAKQIVGSLLDVLVATIEGGKVDGGAALMLGTDNVEFVAGGFVADGMSLQQQLKKLVALAKQSGENDAKIEDLKFNAEQHGGVDFHTFTVPVPADDEKARQALGDKLPVVIGTGTKSAFLGFGEDSSALLKRVIDASAKNGQPEVIPVELHVSLAPILEFAAAMEKDPIVKVLADTARRAAGKDEIHVTQKAINRGISVRVEVEEGVLQLIGTAAKARNNLGQ
ncbi:MAG: hypothetical protein AB7O38_30990 [Pirellulaceae bacterium]